MLSEEEKLALEEYTRDACSLIAITPHVMFMANKAKLKIFSSTTVTVVESNALQ